MFEPQRRSAEERGFQCSLLSYEDLHQEQLLVLRPRPEEGEPLLLRGWMLSPADYAELEQLVRNRDLELVVSADQYQSCHWLSGWYENIQEFTAETAFDEQVLKAWGRAFVKDQVKSCGVGGPPIVSNPGELEQLRAKMLEYRGEIEGGLCFRRVEDYLQETRVFVWRDRAHGLDLTEAAQELANQVKQRIFSPFYSIDLGLRSDGSWRVIEIGDGQVSDLKEWSADQLFSILQSPSGGQSKSPLLQQL
ncbi:ATP-grasp domain-containing protein [bacterium]|nr:ATP-grasp domain-containing protein [bacterium]